MTTLADFGLGNMNFNVSGVIGTANTAALVIVGIVVVIVFVLVVRYILKFKYPVTLWIVTDQGGVLEFDKAWVDTKNRECKLFGHRDVSCAYPVSEHFLPSKKKLELFGYVENSACAWTTFKTGEGYVACDQNMMNFVADMFHRVDEATKLQQKWWEKYAAQLIWLATIAIFMLCIIFILKSVDRAIDMGGSIASRYITLQESGAIQKAAIMLPVLFMARRK